MKKEQVEIYSDASNVAVMRHPDRRFPGSLIQGDSLYLLYQLAKGAQKSLACENRSEAVETLDELVERLGSRLHHYEETLQAHGIELPYVRNE